MKLYKARAYIGSLWHWFSISKRNFFHKNSAVLSWIYSQVYAVGKIDRSHEVKTGVQPGLIQLFFPLALISYTLGDNKNSGLTWEHILPKTLLYMYNALWATVFLFYYHQKSKPTEQKFVLFLCCWCDLLP